MDAPSKSNKREGGIERNERSQKLKCSLLYPDAYLVVMLKHYSRSVSGLLLVHGEYGYDNIQGTILLADFGA